MLKRALSLLIVLCMALTMAVACTKGSDGEETGTETAGADVAAPEAVKKEWSEIDKYVYTLAQNRDFSGKTFTWIGGGSQAPTAEEETGEYLSDAFYFRQRDIEKSFGISWENYSPEVADDEVPSMHPIVEAVITDVMAGTGAYNAGYGTEMAVCVPLFNKSAVLDISALEGIDLSRDWWYDGLKDNYNFGGAVYFANGDVTSSGFTSECCVVYNRDILGDDKADELYETAMNGEWTIDRMLETASTVPVNEDGEGAYRFSEPHGIDIIFGAGYTMTKMNEDGTPYIEADYPSEIQALSERLSPIFSDDTLTVNLKGELTGNYENMNEKYGYAGDAEMFADGRILFHFTTLGEAAELRCEGVDMGILPIPKGDAAQESYVSYVDPWASFNVFVPSSVKDADMTGVILEAMAALGHKYIRYACYAEHFTYGEPYDEETAAMLDLIVDGRAYDIIHFLTEEHEHSTYTRVLKGAIVETSDSIGSKYKMQAKMINRNIKEMLENIERDAKK